MTNTLENLGPFHTNMADSGRRLLRSAVDRTCVVPRTHNMYGDNSFTAAGPPVWNSKDML